MTRDPWETLEGAARVAFLHAHPDDETIQTGALIAWLTGRGASVSVVTCTRGELGEVVPGSIADDDPRDLDDVRVEELRAATAALGAESLILGTAPALAAGASPRRYSDSGMVWVREGLAGPAPEAPAHAFSVGSLDDEVDDAVAALRHAGAEVLVSYDSHGSYGHPDHIRAHEVAVRAAADVGIPLVQVASTDEQGALVDARADAGCRDLLGTLEPLVAALGCYRTQLTVIGVASDEGHVLIEHVGGQRQRVVLATWLLR